MGIKLKDMDCEAVQAFCEITHRKGKVLLDRKSAAYELWVEQDYIFVQELNANFFYGEYCRYDADEQEYIFDYNIYIVYDAVSGEELYMTGEVDFLRAVLGYCDYMQINKTIKDVLEMSCTYFLDNGIFLKYWVMDDNSFTSQRKTVRRRRRRTVL